MLKNNLNFDFIFGEPFLRRLQWPTLLNLLEVGPGLTVLDIGAGRMRHALRLVKTGSRVIAVDLSFRPEDELRAHRRGVVPLVADACQQLPLPDVSVDCILLSSVLHMVATPEQLLRECRRVLKPGGSLVVSVPNVYRFAPRILTSPFWSILRRLGNLPGTHRELIALLNGRFGVGGPRGYYTLEELDVLTRGAGFSITDHVHSPGPAGTLLWELGVLAFIRFGTIAFHGLLPLYPLAWVLDRLLPAANAGEHILKLGVRHDV